MTSARTCTGAAPMLVIIEESLKPPVCSTVTSTMST